MLRNDVLQADEQRGGLPGVRAGADAQVRDRLGQAQVGEEDVRHQRVVVLTGVDDALPHTELAECSHHRGRFHEIGTSTQNVQDQGVLPH